MNARQHISAAEYRQTAKKPNKYGAKRVTLDGISFDSKAEAAYYAGLKVRERAGEVFEVELQKPYALTINGVLVASYRSDFAFYDAIEKRNRCIDVKGFDTPVSKLKRKMVRAIYGIDVEVVR